MLLISSKPSLLKQELFAENELPVEIIEKSRLIHTENGVTSEADANKIERYIGDNSQLVFSEGFKVIFYNNAEIILSNLSAINAVIYEKSNTWGSVLLRY